MVVKVSVGESGMEVLGSKTAHRYGDEAGTTAVFPSAAWHRSVAPGDTKTIFKVTVFLSLSDSTYFSTTVPNNPKVVWVTLW